MKTTLVSMTLLLNLFFISATNAKETTDIKIQTIPVAGNISMIVGVNGFAGGNVGVSTGEDGILIIDDQLQPFSKKLESELQTLSKGNKNSLKFILNTHWHFDHTGGNAHFGKEAIIIAHENVRKLLKSPQEIKFLNKKVAASPKQALPVITFKESMTVHFNNEEIQIIHFPNGHTDGDSIIYFKESNVLHLGDHFFNAMFPFIDVEHGGNASHLVHNIASIIKQFPSNVKIIPGHGDLAKMDDLKKYHNMLVETVKIVREDMNNGKSLAQIQSAGLPKKWESWAWSFIDSSKWIAIIHASILEENFVHTSVTKEN